MYEVQLGDNGNMQRMQQCKQFHENIVTYNNSILFAFEGVDNVDHAVAPFTFRVQGNIYHYLPALVLVNGKNHALLKIYTVDSIQQQADDPLQPTSLLLYVFCRSAERTDCMLCHSVKRNKVFH